MNNYDLKDEKQAKEYLDNLGIEYRFQCYHEHLPDGCHRLGDFLESMRKDFKKASVVYKKNCDENKHGHSCFKYGIYNLVGRGDVEKNQEEGLKLFVKSCEYKYIPACHNAGLMYSSNKVSTSIDMPKAIEYLDKACSKGSVSSCYQLSGIYIQGKNIIPKDMKKAFEYSTKACEFGSINGCANLSQMYKKGEGVDKNENLAEQFSAKAKEMHQNVSKPKRTLTFN